ncbi:peptidase A24A prepilin type IV [Paenibacillus curdlanolyticus YK9]|uniref:Peptidase A24A prepilin type IV n=1 Tax=Paenibacillus curdlanolyticus YK9 TaxID=717606 RepID=E0I6T4_9BACL|nr:prepilin peptidase [Paenibacillus curdlanolyticus]EFM11750.1 peptidase A24A prepilin type IV [Paenibacillus curdlanolyticus YK9]
MLEQLGACVLVVIAFATDVRSMRIPNWLTGGSFAAALLAHVLAAGVGGLQFALVGAVAGLVPLVTMYAIKGVGAGDVKLFAALGAWLGTSDIIQLFVYSILYAGALGVLMLVIRRLLVVGAAMRESWGAVVAVSGLFAGGTRFPFMLAVAPAAVTCWLF